MSQEDTLKGLMKWDIVEKEIKDKSLSAAFTFISLN